MTRQFVPIPHIRHFCILVGLFLSAITTQNNFFGHLSVSYAEMSVRIIGFGLALFFLIGLVDSSKILLVPGANPSHVIHLTSTVQPLVANGHVVHMVIEDTLDIPQRILKNGVKIKKYPVQGNTSKFSVINIR
jgi:hypothetical protein